MTKQSGMKTVLVLFCVCAMAMVSCGGGGGSNSTDAPPAPRTPQFVLDPVGTTSNAGSLTMGVSKPGLDANFADELVVFARLLDPQGLPLVGVNVGFAADFPDASFLPTRTPPAGVEQSGFPSGAALTDSRGIAQVTLVAPSQPGRMAIVAQTSRDLLLSGLIYVTVYDVGFIPSPGNLPTLIPSEITVSDPSAGAQLQFVIVGGVPFVDPEEEALVSDQEPDVGFILSDPAGPAAVVPPYILENPASGIGLAELIFNGRFPATILYTLSGRAAGAHAFGVIDAEGSVATGTVTAEFTPVIVTPESVSVEVGTSQDFAITGGVPPYACTTSGGLLTPSTVLEQGGTTEFVPASASLGGTFPLVCTDASGQAGSATVEVRGSLGPSPTPAPQAARVEIWASPPTLNGPFGGVSVVTARVLSENFEPLPGEPVLFSLEGQVNEPPPTLPSITPTTGISDADGEVMTTLTIPPQTAPQFLVVKAETPNGSSNIAQVAITSQVFVPSGPPANISAAALREDACQINQDGTLTAIVSALVSDAEGNPVDRGIAVEWSLGPSTSVDVIALSFTNGEVPCTVDQYRAPCEDGGVLLSISPQPGTATTCITYAMGAGARAATVTARVAENPAIERKTTVRLPQLSPDPTPTAAPAPTPTARPAAPRLVPAFAALAVGSSQDFVIEGGVPPFSVIASGGSSDHGSPSSSRVFSYTAEQVGEWTLIVTDAIDQVSTAVVQASQAIAIQVSNPGPIVLDQGEVGQIEILGGGTPPYAFSADPSTLVDFITNPPVLNAPGIFSFTGNQVGSGQIVITDEDGLGTNSRSIAVTVQP